MFVSTAYAMSSGGGGGGGSMLDFLLPFIIIIAIFCYGIGHNYNII